MEDGVRSSDEDMGSAEADLLIDLPAHAAEARSDSLKDKRPSIYNAAGLLEKLEDIAWTSEAPWDEAQVVTASSAEQVEDVDDDLARELSFYNQALEASQQAIRQYEQAGTPWLRPPDYYAEMVKSDDHMARVKQQLIYEQNQLEATEERRKQREARKFQKAVQAERLKEKAQAKKHGIESVSRLRRNRAKSGYQGELDVDEVLGDGPASVRPKPSRPGERISQDRHKVGKKRQAKNDKFGFGGRKRLKKQNDAGSAADMDSFRQGRFQTGSGRGRGASGGSFGKQGGHRQGRVGQQSNTQPGGGAGKGRRSKPNRPGKARRQAMRSK